MGSLEGRIALVTGASGGIGEAIRGLSGSRACALSSTAVPKLPNGSRKLCATKRLMPLLLRGDVTNKNEVDALVAWIENEMGPLWLLVNNAGVLNRAPILEMTEQAWDEAMAGNMKSAFLCSQAALGYMLPRHAGRIVNIGSIAGISRVPIKLHTRLPKRHWRISRAVLRSKSRRAESRSIVSHPVLRKRP